MIDWGLVAAVVGLVAFAFAFGGWLGYDLGRFEANSHWWRKRDEAWDKEHGVGSGAK